MSAATSSPPAPAGSPPRARRLRRRIDPALALAVLPIAVFAVVGWELRWVNEDGFIYFRVVDQLLAGQGPVFNPGERVEAYTSPAWLAVLAASAAALPFARLEHLAVVIGLAVSVGGLVAACLAAWRLWRVLAAPETRLAPLGAVVVAAVPAFWGFETSGLETGLVFGWLGACFLVLVALVARRPGAGRRRRAGELAAAGFVGLGPLVRPDLAPFSLCFLVALLVAVRPRSVRSAAALVVWAVALPLAYQVFRMGYFAALVPGTALAKEAGLAYWPRGLGYLANLVVPYALPIPLVVLGWLGWRVAAPAWRAGLRATVLVAAAPVAAALLHALYVVRLGGDYMHGRMLLPSLFALVMPVALAPLPRRRALAAAACVLVVAWGAVCALALRTPSEFGPAAGRWQILDQRAKQRDTPSHPHPVTLADHDALPLSQPRVGYAARSLAKPGGSMLVLDARMAPRRTADGWVPVQVPLPLDVRAAAWVRAPVVIFTGSIGRLGYAAGPEVWIADRLGLADPIASRLRLPPDRPRRAGHEKLLSASWFLARFADPASVGDSPRFAANPRIPAARDALGCPALHRLMAAIREPLTLTRFLTNLGEAVPLTALRVPSEPLAARRELCSR